MYYHEIQKVISSTASQKKTHPLPSVLSKITHLKSAGMLFLSNIPRYMAWGFQKSYNSSP